MGSPPSANGPCHGLALALILLSAACATVPTPPGLDEGPEFDISPEEDAWAWIHGNPCGYLTVQRPLFNVSGEVTGKADGEGRFSLHIAPNRTVAGVRFAAGQCAPLMAARLASNGSFVLKALPVGDYVIAVTGRELPDHASVRLFGAHPRGNYIVSVQSYRGRNGTLLALLSIRAAHGPRSTRKPKDINPSLSLIHI